MREHLANDKHALGRRYIEINVSELMSKRIIGITGTLGAGKVYPRTHK